MTAQFFFWGREALAGAGVGLSFVLIFSGSEFWRRSRAVPVEWTRKAVHVGCGLVVCAFPWLFQSPWSVLALCLVFGAVLILARALKFLPSVQAVERRSAGDLLFPAAVLSLFWLAHDRPALYLVPMLILVLSDALAALVGGAYGRLRYEVDRGELKSLEGSLAFYLCSFLVTYLPLLTMTDLDRSVCALAALQMAFLATCFEALCLDGIDNLVLPLGGYYVLIQLVKGDASWISAQLAVQASLLLLTVTLVWRYRFLSVSAALAAQLYLYGTFAFGGFSWLAAPFAAFFFFLFIRVRRSRSGDGPLEHHSLLPFFYFTLTPALLLLLYNFRVAFAASTPYGLVRLLPALFSCLHGAELACVCSLFGRGPLDGRQPLPSPLIWAPAGAALGALTALPALWNLGRVSAADLGWILLLGSLPALLFRPALRLSGPPKTAAARSRRLFAASALSATLVVTALWIRTP